MNQEFKIITDTADVDMFHTHTHTKKTYSEVKIFHEKLT